MEATSYYRLSKQLVDSQPGEGTTFTVLLPIKGAKTTASANRQATIGKYMRMENKSIPEPSILFVDDEEIIRKSLIRELQMERFAVKAAAGGSEAVAALKESQYDLVITDLIMPGVDGFGVLKAAKKIAPLTSVIILTNSGVMQYAIDALRHGADDIVSKPCDIDELVSRIRHCLERRSLLLEREQSMQTLRESEKRNRSIVNASPDGIIIANMEGQILMVSPAGLSMFGYDPDDKCQGHWTSEFIAPEDRGHALSNIAPKVQTSKRDRMNTAVCVRMEAPLT